MTARISVLLVLIAAFAAGGCSQSEAPTDPGLVDSAISPQVEDVSPELAPPVGEAFVGNWKHTTSPTATLEVKRMGKNRFKLHGESVNKAWDGIGRVEGNELIAVWWIDWSVYPSEQNLQAYVTYHLHPSGVMTHDSYFSDGTWYSGGAHVRN